MHNNELEVKEYSPLEQAFWEPPTSLSLMLFFSLSHVGPRWQNVVYNLL